MDTALKRIRKRLALSQTKLAQALGIPQTTLSLYESADGTEIPSAKAKRLIEVAKVYGLTIDFNHIYGDVDLPPPLKIGAAELPPAPPPPQAFPQLQRRRVVLSGGGAQ